MNTIMNWASVVMAALTLIALAGVIGDEVRGRLSRPGKATPLQSMTIGDILLGLGFIAPFLIAGWGAIAYL